MWKSHLAGIAAAGNVTVQVMSSQTISTDRIFRFTITLLVVSCVSVVAFILIRDTASVRGPAGGIGIMSSLTGSAVAGWFAFRSRDCRLIAAAFFSGVPLAFWVWAIYDVLHVNTA